MNVKTGTTIPMIIYKGSAQTLTDIAGGQVTDMLEPIDGLPVYDDVGSPGCTVWQHVLEPDFPRGA